MPDRFHNFKRLMAARTSSKVKIDPIIFYFADAINLNITFFHFFIGGSSHALHKVDREIPDYCDEI